MRKFLGLGTALLALLGLSAVAIAGSAGPSPSGQTQTLEASHATKKVSTKKKKVGSKVTITLTLTKTDGTKPSPTTRAVVHLPSGMTANYGQFPACNAKKLQANGPKACPKGSQVGTGSLKADATPVVPDPVGGTVKAFNGTGRTYLLYIVPDISSPLIIPGKLKGSKKNLILDFSVPLVPTLPGQPNATLTYFTVTTGGTYKKKVHGKKKKFNYLENPTKCPAGGYPWKIDFTYENGESLSPTDPAPCTK
jgi:hypothetical protein